MTERLSGTSQTFVLARVLMGDLTEADGRAAWSQPVRVVRLINHTVGPARDTGWVERLQGLRSTVEVVPAVVEGSLLRITEDLASAPGYLYLSHPDADQVRQDYETIRRWELEGLYVARGVGRPTGSGGRPSPR